MSHPPKLITAAVLLGLLASFTGHASGQAARGRTVDPRLSPARTAHPSPSPKGAPAPQAQQEPVQAPAADELRDWTKYVPRQPMWVINAGVGLRNHPLHPEENQFGFATWWRGPNAVDNLIDRIDAGYQLGARWFFVNRPMGTLGYTHVPAASWLTLSEERREELPRKLTDALLDRYDEPVHIVWFIGSDMKDPRSLVGWTSSNSDDYFLLGEDDTWEEQFATRSTIGGWLSTGASGLGIDHSAAPAKRDHFIEMFHQLIRPPFNLLLIGEAVPSVRDDRGRPIPHAKGAHTVDIERVKKMPWLAHESYFDSRYPVSFGPGVDSMDPESTRVYIWFERTAIHYGNPEQRERLVDRWIDRGLIPMTFDPVMFRRAMERFNSGR